MLTSQRSTLVLVSTAFPVPAARSVAAMARHSALAVAAAAVHAASAAPSLAAAVTQASRIYGRLAKQSGRAFVIVIYGIMTLVDQPTVIQVWAKSKSERMVFKVTTPDY